MGALCCRNGRPHNGPMRAPMDATMGSPARDSGHSAIWTRYRGLLSRRQMNSWRDFDRPLKASRSAIACDAFLLLVARCLFCQPPSSARLRLDCQRVIYPAMNPRAPLTTRFRPIGQPPADGHLSEPAWRRPRNKAPQMRRRNAKQIRSAFGAHNGDAWWRRASVTESAGKQACHMQPYRAPLTRRRLVSGCWLKHNGWQPDCCCHVAPLFATVFALRTIRTACRLMPPAQEPGELGGARRFVIAAAPITKRLATSARFGAAEAQKASQERSLNCCWQRLARIISDCGRLAVCNKPIRFPVGLLARSLARFARRTARIIDSSEGASKPQTARAGCPPSLRLARQPRPLHLGGRSTTTSVGARRPPICFAGSAGAAAAKLRAAGTDFIIVNGGQKSATTCCPASPSKWEELST